MSICIRCCNVAVLCSLFANISALSSYTLAKLSKDMYTDTVACMHVQRANSCVL